MTRTICFKKIKIKLCIALALICSLCFCLALSACGTKQESVTDPSYAYTESENDVIISNASFALGLENTAYGSFPITSATGWSNSAEGSSSSKVSSGVINTNAVAFETLLKTLLSDDEYVNYLASVNDKEVSYIKEHISEFVTNPGKAPGGQDDFVYMLNNYAKKNYEKMGASQKITSSSPIAIKAGESYSISVYVKGQNVFGANAESDFINVRLVNSFNGTTQADYRIKGIKNTEWTKYTVYVKGDANYDTSVTLVLALGNTTNSDNAMRFAGGTVYFDEIKVEKVDAVPTAVTSTMTYGSKDGIANDASEGVDFVYDMSLVNTSLGSIVKTPINFNTEDACYFYTKSNKTNTSSTYITAQDICADGSVTVNGKGTDTLTIDLDRSSYTAKISNSSFALNGKQYGYVSFSIKNELNVLHSTDITVNVVEKDSLGNALKVYPTNAKFNAVGDTKTCGLLIKNNFATGSGIRYFDVEVVAGPADISTITHTDALAIGKVTVKDVTVLSGEISNDDTDAIEYKLYTLFGNTANATVALFAGYGADYVEPSKDTNTYNLSISPSNFGDILFAPTAVKSYSGITSNHIYLKEQVEGETLETAVNDRVGSFTGSRGYAGLINTKYLTNYANSELDNALDWDSSKDDIQPIVIYNSANDHYGFIGESQTISASGYAKVSVTVRVTENAKAYVYIVNSADKNKDVLTLKTSENSTEHKLMLEVTSSTANVEGWVTVEFYVATGATAKEFRVEVWNGGRNGETETASQGYVFVKDITVTTSSAFTEPTSVTSAYATSGTPLSFKQFGSGETETYTRPLTSVEKQFNKEHPDKKVSYEEKYVWAETDTMLYAVYNSIDPVKTNPYDSITDKTEGSGCTAVNSSTFWMGFSSILLAVILLMAIIALIVKNVVNKRKANKNDAKSHYTVKSRIKTNNENKKLQAKKEKAIEKEETQEEVKEPIEEQPEETEQKEQDLDSYVYGEVQDFGDAVTNEEPKEETSEEQPIDDKKD